MNNSKNKANLLDFLSQMLSECKARILSPGVSIMLGGTFSETSNAVKLDCICQYINEERSGEEHEGADTRISAHIDYSANHCGSSRIVVNATDTDIIYYASITCVICSQ